MCHFVRSLKSSGSASSTNLLWAFPETSDLTSALHRHQKEELRSVQNAHLPFLCTSSMRPPWRAWLVQVMCLAAEASGEVAAALHEATDGDVENLSKSSEDSTQSLTPSDQTEQGNPPEDSLDRIQTSSLEPVHEPSGAQAGLVDDIPEDQLEKELMTPSDSQVAGVCGASSADSANCIAPSSISHQVTEAASKEETPAQPPDLPTVSAPVLPPPQPPAAPPPAPPAPAPPLPQSVDPEAEGYAFNDRQAWLSIGKRTESELERRMRLAMEDEVKMEALHSAEVLEHQQQSIHHESWAYYEGDLMRMAHRKLLGLGLSMVSFCLVYVGAFQILWARATEKITRK